MIIAIVQIPRSGPKPDKETSVANALKSAENYRDVKGLIRKDFLNGEEGGGGVYLFESRETASAWFNDGWADWIEGRLGARPTLTMYDHYLTLDNAAGEIRIDGKPVENSKADAAE